MWFEKEFHTDEVAFSSGLLTKKIFYNRKQDYVQIIAVNPFYLNYDLARSFRQFKRRIII